MRLHINHTLLKSNQMKQLSRNNQSALSLGTQKKKHIKSAIKSNCFVSPNFMSRPFCLHVAMLQDGASSGVFFL